ncbi:hypothetical protein AX17_006684 [Amanita inopinata Kibby_2008]|nr:hypothetical protein AX17_006684 [Amanita inopinata Kibby_2008]
MAPLAGRPPFATDEPDSIYETPQPHRRLGTQAPEDPNKRTSAYDMYNNYLDADQHAHQSGTPRMGMGSYDEGPRSKPISKNAALAAATGATQPLRTLNHQPMNIAAPRPGYAAPIAALNLSRPESAASPQGRRPSADAQQPMADPFAHRTLENPFEPPSSGRLRAQYSSSASPSLPPTPHPLQPPMTPIVPVFARPAKQTAITFDEKPRVCRTEDTVLPSREQRGDDFWKRFSIVAKEPTSRKESNWLKKTKNGASQLSRWVWVVGIVLLLCVVGAVGLRIWLTRNNPNHQQPKAFGGSADQAATASPSSGPGGTMTSLHVSPTYTVARRNAWNAAPTTIPLNERNTSRASRHKNRLIDVVL